MSHQTDGSSYKYRKHEITDAAWLANEEIKKRTGHGFSPETFRDWFLINFPGLTLSESPNKGWQNSHFDPSLTQWVLADYSKGRGFLHTFFAYNEELIAPHHEVAFFWHTSLGGDFCTGNPAWSGLRGFSSTVGLREPGVDVSKVYLAPASLVNPEVSMIESEIYKRLGVEVHLYTQEEHDEFMARREKFSNS